MSSNVSLASILPDLASPESLVLPLALKVQWRMCAVDFGRPVVQTHSDQCSDP